jgi:hypothetical protein
MRAQLQNALQFHEAGIQLVPIVSGQKYNIEDYNIYLQEPQTENDIHKYFDSPTPVNIGWVSGVRSNNLLTLDFEEVKDFKLARELSPSFDEICNKTNLSFTAHGGIHAHVRIKNPNIHRSFKLNHNGRDVGDAKFTGYTIEPDSYLIEGGKILPYTMIDGFKGIYEVDTVYDLQLDPFFSNLYNATRSQALLKPPTQLLPLESPKLLIRGFGDKYKRILEGDLQGYISRSEAEFAILVRGVGLDRSEAEMKLLFDEYGAKDQLKYFNYKGDRNKRFHEEYNRAYTWVHSQSTPFNTNVTLSYYYYKHRRKMPQSLRKIILGILNILRTAGLDKLHCLSLSTRQIAEESGVSHGTVLNHLKETGIKLVSHYNGFKASVYDVSNLVCIPDHTYSGRIVEEWSNLHSKSGIRVNSDISRSRALGLDADIILSSLVIGTEKTINEWGKQWNNMIYKSAKRKLELLEMVGLVETGYTIKRGKGSITYKVLTEVTSDRVVAICEAAKTYGAKERQHDQYEMERDYQFKWINSPKEHPERFQQEEIDQ